MATQSRVRTSRRLIAQQARLAGVIGEIEEIADRIQNSRVAGSADFARELDIVANSLDSLRIAGMDNELVYRDTSGENPGSKWADENGRYDRLDVDPDQYHRTPTGPRDMQSVGAGIDNATGKQRTTGVQSPQDYDLEFASESPVYIQAGGRRKAEPEGDASAFDPGNPLDPFTTAGMPASGNESLDPPIDKRQEGEKLQFFGTDEYTTKKTSGRNRNAHLARKILEEASAGERVAGEVIIKDAKNLHRDEEGDEVLRDQDLGGFGDDPRYREHYSAGAKQYSTNMPEELDYEESEDENPVDDDEVAEALDGVKTDDHFSRESSRDMRENRPRARRDSASDFGGETPRAKRKSSRAKVTVYRPEFVPAHLEPLWQAATTRVANVRKLVTANGQVNYGAITREYRRALANSLSFVENAVSE